MSAAERAIERWTRIDSPTESWPPSRDFLWNHAILSEDDLADVRRELAERQAAARKREAA